MRACLWFAMIVLPGWIYAQTGEHPPDHSKMRNETDSRDPAPITITINPEARVSAALTGALPATVRCSAVADLTIRIVNQGFVTSRLEAEFAGAVPEGVELDFHPAPLTGVREEVRHLRITLTKPSSADLTIAFRAHDEIPDLGGRDRVHFLMRCLPAE